MLRVHPSALKHGIDEEDSRRAVQARIHRVSLDEEVPQRQLVLGFDRSARLLEVVVVVYDDGRLPMIIHAMPARLTYRRLVKEGRPR